MTGHLALRIDPTVCDGVGMCVLRAPHLISLDRWGFPLLDPRPIPVTSGRLIGEAERAVLACPRRALYLLPIDPS